MKKFFGIIASAALIFTGCTFDPPETSDPSLPSYGGGVSSQSADSNIAAENAQEGQADDNTAPSSFAINYEDGSMEMGAYENETPDSSDNNELPPAVDVTDGNGIDNSAENGGDETGNEPADNAETTISEDGVELPFVPADE